MNGMWTSSTFCPPGSLTNGLPVLSSTNGPKGFTDFIPLHACRYKTPDGKLAYGQRATFKVNGQLLTGEDSATDKLDKIIAASGNFSQWMSDGETRKNIVKEVKKVTSARM